MEPATARRTAIIITRAVLTGLALVAIAPASVDASCSHYVHARTNLSKFELSLAEIENADFPSTTMSASTPVDHERRRPCSGALCSGQPASPLSPTQIDVPRAGQWAIIAPPVHADVAELVFSPRIENVLLPCHYSTSVYHPPRLPRPFRAL
jgi:hypothetical protein